MTGVLPIEIHEHILMQLTKIPFLGALGPQKFRETILNYASAIPELKQARVVDTHMPSAKYVKLDDIPRPIQATMAFSRMTDSQITINRRLAKHLKLARTMRLTILQHKNDYASFGIGHGRFEADTVFIGSFTVDIDLLTRVENGDRNEVFSVFFCGANGIPISRGNTRAKLFVQSSVGSDLFIIDSAMSEIQFAYQTVKLIEAK